MSDGIQRRLAAVVSLDVAGYSRLIGNDETGTLAALRDHRSELIDPAIATHNGRIVKTMGDGLLLDFPSVVNAVRCTIDVQEGMAIRNANVSIDRRIQFRIGINLADIVIEGDDIFGDGVNIAARLQEACKVGELALSGIAYDGLGSLIDDAFQDDGDHTFKNIARPVQVWRWMPRTEPALLSTTMEANQPIQEKPSIAVLPFDNMSNDADQEYFADGISDDLIAALSRYNWFSITARSSSFAYRGQSTDVRRVGEELGVQFVVEGSVRRAGSRVRIFAQLVEAFSGHHLWSERYDRELADIFDLQDEISSSIAAEIEPELTKFESHRARNVSPDKLNAWDRYLRGVWHLYRFTKEDNDEARHWLNSALEHQSEFAPALGLLAYILALDVSLAYADDVDDVRQKALEYGRRAVAADPRNHLARHGLGRALAINGQSQQALLELRKCVELNPSFAQGYFSVGRHLTFAGRPTEAIPQLERAMSLSPHDSNVWGFFVMTATARLLLGEYELCLEFAEEATRANPAQFYPHVVRASALGSLGRFSEAQDAIETARTIKPSFSLANLRHLLDEISERTWKLFVQGLSDADIGDQQ